MALSLLGRPCAYPCSSRSAAFECLPTSKRWIHYEWDWLWDEREWDDGGWWWCVPLWPPNLDLPRNDPTADDASSGPSDLSGDDPTADGAIAGPPNHSGDDPSTADDAIAGPPNLSRDDPSTADDAISGRPNLSGDDPTAHYAISGPPNLSGDDPTADDAISGPPNLPGDDPTGHQPKVLCPERFCAWWCATSLLNPFELDGFVEVCAFRDSQFIPDQDLAACLYEASSKHTVSDVVDLCDDEDDALPTPCGLVWQAVPFNLNSPLSTYSILFGLFG